MYSEHLQMFPAKVNLFAAKNDPKTVASVKFNRLCPTAKDRLQKLPRHTVPLRSPSVNRTGSDDESPAVAVGPSEVDEPSVADESAGADAAPAPVSSSVKNKISQRNIDSYHWPTCRLQKRTHKRPPPPVRLKQCEITQFLVDF